MNVTMVLAQFDTGEKQSWLQLVTEASSYQIQQGA